MSDPDKSNRVLTTERLLAALLGVITTGGAYIYTDHVTLTRDQSNRQYAQFSDYVKEQSRKDDKRNELELRKVEQINTLQIQVGALNSTNNLLNENIKEIRVKVNAIEGQQRETAKIAQKNSSNIESMCTTLDTYSEMNQWQRKGCTK